MPVTAKHRWLVAILLLLIGGGGLIVWLVQGPEPPFRAQGVDAPIVPVQWQACGFEAPTGVHVRCGWYETGERTGGGDPIRLRLLMLRRTAEPPHAPVTLHIPGGPGAPAGTGRDAAGQWATWMLRHGFPGRLLLFDPRGTGASRPVLDCPARVLATRARLAHRSAGTNPLAVKQHRLDACRARLLAQRLDPADFAAHRMLADVPRLIRAIGVYRVRLLGLSHGSRIALALLRQSPERFSTAVLDGVFPTERDPFQLQAGLETMARARLVRPCREGAADCEVPVESTAYRILRSQVSRSPPLVHVPQPGTWPQPQPLWLTAERLQDLVFAAQSAGASPTSMRRALQQAVTGDYSALVGLFAGPLARTVREDRHEPVYWESLCAEAGGLDADAGAASHPCRSGWGRPGLPDGFRVPVATDHRVLLLAGARDPVTPVSWAREQRARMPRSHLLIGTETAHGTLFSGDCIGGAVAEFLRHPDGYSPPERCPGPSSVIETGSTQIP